MSKSLACLFLAAAAVPALTAEPAVERLVDCAAIPDATQRLACFDREIAPLARAASAGRSRASGSLAVNPPVVAGPSAAPAVPPAATSAPTPATAARPTRDSFGDEQLRPEDRETAREEQILHARIERLRNVTAVQSIVYLDNGQAWRHEDQANGAYLRTGDAVTIRKATLGSYRLTRDAGSSKNWIRVTRIR
jgi:hypothetical protein